MAVNVQINHFRFGNNDGTGQGDYTFKANIDINPTHNWDWATFNLRFNEQETGGTAIANCDATFEYQKNSGLWSSLTTTSSNVKVVSGNGFTNGGDCTQRLGGTGTFETTGAGVTTDGTSGGTANDIAASGCSETVCALQFVAADLANGDIIAFRITSPDTTFTMAVSPSITIVKVAAATNDSLTLAENVAIGFPLANISASAYETLQLTEVFTSLWDTLALAEYVNINLPVNITASAFDSITLSENLTSGIALSGNVFDGVTLAEYTAAGIISSASAFDSLTLAEDLSSNVTDNNLHISVFDTLNLTEVFTSLWDTLALSESVSLAGLVANISASVSDSLTLSEARGIDTDTMAYIQDEYIALSELASVSYSHIGASTSDTLTHSESVSTTISAGVDYESLTLAESVLLNTVQSASANETETLSEYVNCSGIGVVHPQINESESKTLSESVSFNSRWSASANESLTHSESVTGAIVLSISVLDSKTLSESISATVNTGVSASESLGLTDSPSINIISNLSVSVNEALALSESVSFGKSDEVNVSSSENTQISEVVVFELSDVWCVESTTQDEVWVNSESHGLAYKDALVTSGYGSNLLITKGFGKFVNSVTGWVEAVKSVDETWTEDS